MKSFAVLVTLTVGAALAAGQVAAKHPWASFGVGSWAHLKTTSVVNAGGQKIPSVIETKMTLVAKTADKVTIENEVIMGGRSISKTKMDLPLKGAAAATAAKPPAGAQFKTGSETITVAGRALKCITSEGVMDAGGTKTQSKTWISDQVPGGLVKSQSSNAASETKMEMVDFKAL
jgi:hypothetical protein